MFSALKRWTKMGNDDSKLSMPTGVRAMGQALQRKFARGVQYNMKIVIKGDRNTGKTCMFQRLHGKPFTEQYIPTNEIQVGSIQWSYKATDDVVKVELWDVVDVGKSKKGQDSLKIENEADSQDGKDAVLDAGFVDVYKGTHGVLMMLDITKPWTLQYVRRELPKVPPHIPVLVVANRRDMDEHRLVESDEIISLIESLQRPDRSPPVHYAESSMRNGFGLKYIHTFLSFPFLMLQRETLLQQLQVNAVEMESNLEELQIHKESEEQDYEKYLSFLDRRKIEREAELAAKAAEAAAAEAATEETGNKTPSAGTPSTASSTDKIETSPAPVAATNGDSRGGSGGGGLMRRWFSSSKPNISTSEEVIPRKLRASSSTTNIEEFTPGDELDAGFLDEKSTSRDKSTRSKKKKAQQARVDVHETPSESSDDSDSGSNTGNPMVAGFAEDISSDEEDSRLPTSSVPNGNVDSQSQNRTRPTNKSRPVKPVMTDIVLTSSEEEEEEEEEAVVTPIPKQKTPPSKTKKQFNLKIDTKGAQNAKRAENTKRAAMEGTGENMMDDWLNSPEQEPQMTFQKPADYNVRRVDVHSPEPAVQSSPITTDDWEMFMSQQMTSAKAYPAPTTPSASMLNDDDDDDDAEEESRKHGKTKEHKSGEKSHSKHKNKKHRDKDEDGHKEKRRSKHGEAKHGEAKHGEAKHGEAKHGEAKERKSRDEEGEKKKKSTKHKHHSKRKSADSSGATGLTYEEL